jgi:hypothetical protein
MWEAARVEQGTEQRDTQQSSNEVSLLCTSSGIQAAGTDKREEAQKVKEGKGKGELTYPEGKVWLICPRRLYDARDRYDDDRVAEKGVCIA